MLAGNAYVAGSHKGPRQKENSLRHCVKTLAGPRCVGMIVVDCGQDCRVRTQGPLHIRLQGQERGA